jgi:hypothetical protein
MCIIYVALFREKSGCALKMEYVQAMLENNVRLVREMAKCIGQCPGVQGILRCADKNVL